MKISRLTLFFVLQLTFALFATARQKTNVLILYTDDPGYGDPSCYGAQHIATPQIDWLAQRA